MLLDILHKDYDAKVGKQMVDGLFYEGILSAQNDKSIGRATDRPALFATIYNKQTFYATRHVAECVTAKRLQYTPYS